jgi:hypothetical protein
LFGAVVAAILVASPAARAQGASSSSPLDVVVNGMKLTTTPREPDDFVRKTRKPNEALDYVPIAGERRDPAKRLMTGDEIRAREAELDAVRSRHDAVSRRRPATGRFRSAAPPVVARKETPSTKCLITCGVSSTVATSVTSAVAPAATTP